MKIKTQPISLVLMVILSASGIANASEANVDLAKDVDSPLAEHYQAALNGESEGLMAMVSLYERIPGWGSEEPLQYWLEQLADKGDIGAKAKLCEFENQVAFDYCLSAAMSGDTQAMLSIADKYSFGDGVRLSEKMEAYWLLKAAQAGDSRAQEDIGISYFWGRNVPKDYQQAYHWFTLAAQQGEPSAQRFLGQMYLEGTGPVAQDYAQALDWLQQASEQGESTAQMELAIMYYKGVGVEQKKVEAYAWMRLALERVLGIHKREWNNNLASIKSGLSEADIAQGEKLLQKLHEEYLD
ncbi:sel1 repeat family protein [Shewanella submarina]|uniref:Tetratricopeptide repeat protein n=1 Tax=Shewanella submarina TaxID=2016376 RepID=A0ABV7GE28_9GAMM|nr:tetratricopeptide repeat protein [Shewanella submarina]MCL1038020.1 sel1 repeat family protein [Shewanella submarina]